ncbi:hypothetical protein SLS60_002083 [Paraconiothyrium brasiliense]|uniref:F-box domain-containing protein n=1 Tax=Paraconiothyrium brasiliense TaxID=300254 RepID=A0ABR3S157_9PLEO
MAMAAPAFVDAFLLQTPHARRAALAALAAHFSPDEWRQLKALADAKTLQFDIVAGLPPELVFHIFSFLDISTPFRLQAVSRRWCSLLRCTDILKPKLKTWYDGTIALDDASYEDCLRTAQSIHRFRTGNFIQVAASATSVGLVPSPGNHVLVEDFLVDNPEPHRQVRVTNLLSGEETRAATPGREEIVFVAASIQLIACWTGTQTCHVFDFSGALKARFRLPPFMSRFKACRERTIICGGISQQHIELYLWDLDSQKGKTLRLDQPPFESAIADSFHFDENLQIFSEPERLALCSEDIKSAWWKDTFYQVGFGWEGETESRVRIYFKHLGVSGQDSHRAPPSVVLERYGLDSLAGGMHLWLLLNDKFAVVGAMDRIYVFSFVAKAKTTDSAIEHVERENEGKLLLRRWMPEDLAI